MVPRPEIPRTLPTYSRRSPTAKGSDDCCARATGATAAVAASAAAVREPRAAGEGKRRLRRRGEGGDGRGRGARGERESIGRRSHTASPVGHRETKGAVSAAGVGGAGPGTGGGKPPRRVRS